MGCSSSLMVFSLHLSTYKKIMFKMEKLIMLRTEVFKIGLFWINSNSFIRETRFSKFVLLACTQLCRYDSEMSFGKLREGCSWGVPPVQSPPVHALLSGLCVCSSVPMCWNSSTELTSVCSFLEDHEGDFLLFNFFSQGDWFFCGLPLGVSQK